MQGRNAGCTAERPNGKGECRGVRLEGSDLKWRGRGRVSFLKVIWATVRSFVAEEPHGNKILYCCEIYALHQLPFYKIKTKSI